MDSMDLLRREKEYHELNKKLELRTKELLQEVDQVMKSQDLSIQFDASKYALSQEFGVRKSKSVGLGADDPKVDARDCKELNIPAEVNNMGAKGLVHFLKAKAKQLQADHDKLSNEHKLKCEEVKALQKENAKQIGQKEKWLQATSVSKNAAAKLEQQMNVLQSKLSARDNENASLRKEVEQLQKELKSGKASAGSLEVRMARLAEDNEKLKQDLKTIKQEEKDLKDAHKKEVAQLLAGVRKLERGKADLTNGFKKQMLLIDNLKRQKAHIESFKLTEKCEGDLMKLLDWKAE